MNIDWQLVIVYIVVGLAALYVGWMLYASFRGNACNCGKAHCAKHDQDAC